MRNAPLGCTSATCRRSTLRLHRQTREGFRRIVDINFFGAFDLVHAAWPVLSKTGGRIVYIASLGGGMLGYITFEHLSPLDAFLNAAMLLGGTCGSLTALLSGRLDTTSAGVELALVRAFGGMRAILATMSSMSATSIIVLRFSGDSSIWAAPTSSITSIALSGSLRSWM